jgi:phage gp36-like protein
MASIYAQPTDLENRYPNRDLVQLSNEDPAVTTVNSAYLTIHLGDASAEIDSYLESKYQLPLSDPPVLLVRLCCDIAIYRMQELRPLHDLQDARDRYNDAIAYLKRVAAGDVTLGLSADAKEPPPATPSVFVRAARKMFSRRRLRGF